MKSQAIGTHPFIILQIFLVLLSPFLLQSAPLLHKNFHGFNATDDVAKQGIRNPERGFREEILVGEPRSNVGKLKNSIFPVTVTLAYCRLLDFVDRDLSEAKLQLLQNDLDLLRQFGIKALLRFAYEWDMEKKKGPLPARIYQHIEQLAPIIKKNSDVIYAMQAGFIGAWGEWHSSTHHLEKDPPTLRTLVEKLLHLLPAEITVQVRVPKYKRWVLNQEPIHSYSPLSAESALTKTFQSRIGFHNDGFLANRDDGGTWPEAPHFSSAGNPEFDLKTQESPFVPVDGELFVQDLGGKVTGKRAASRMREHHYTTFSQAHSFSNNPNKPFSIDDWHTQSVEKRELEALGWAFDSNYFLNSEGIEVSRTWYDFIRDHLGYQIQLLKASFNDEIGSDKSFNIKATFRNFGFAAPQKVQHLLVALIHSETNNVWTTPVDSVDLRRWYPAHSAISPNDYGVNLSVSLPHGLLPGIYRVGFWIPDPHVNRELTPLHSIRFFNRDTEWWESSDKKYGINLIGQTRVGQ